MEEPEPIGLRERKKIKARLAIERAALELVLERGYDGTTIEDVCARAEISKKTFFNYFPSKSAAVTGRVDAFPSPDELIGMMEARSDICYLDVLVDVVSLDYSARAGDEATRVSELRQQALRKIPQLFFRGQRDLLSLQDAVTQALCPYLEQHPERRLMRSHNAAYEALVASSAVTALARTRSMLHVFYEEEATAEETRALLASYLSTGLQAGATDDVAGDVAEVDAGDGMGDAYVAGAGRGGDDVADAAGAACKADRDGAASASCNADGGC